MPIAVISGKEIICATNIPVDDLVIPDLLEGIKLIKPDGLVT